MFHNSPPHWFVRIGVVKYQKNMKRLNLNPDSAVYMAIVTAITAVWVVTLFL